MPVVLHVAGLRERVRLLAGEVQVVSAAGEGTRVEARIPTGVAATPRARSPAIDS
jgi:signal transduction histidine kinase